MSVMDIHYDAGFPREAGRYCELADVSEVTDLEPGFDFRHPAYRREVFQRFYSFHLETRGHPGCVYYLMPFLAEAFSMTDEERLWFAYINGCTQHPPTSLTIWRRFPSMKEMNFNIFRDWFNVNFKRLGWDSDRRHQKAHFVYCVDNYRTLVGRGTQRELFEEAGGGGDEGAFFRGCWDRIRSDFHSFGRLSTFSYLEYLRIMGLPLDCDQLFLDDRSGSKSHRNGIAVVCGRDDLDWHDAKPFEGGYTDEQMEWLVREGGFLLAEAKERNFGKPWERDVSYFTMESALCTYKSWHRPNRRYPNVYQDMLKLRLDRARKDWPDEDFTVFYEARRQTLPEQLRLEDTPFDAGLRPVKQNWYREHGVPVMMNRYDPAFANDYNERWNP